MQKLTYLITPTLIYFSIQGNQGASNLLVAWSTFGFVMIVLLSLVMGLLVLAGNSAVKRQDEKTQEIVEKFYESLRKAKTMRWFDWLAVVYLIIYCYLGWWVVFVVNMMSFVIFKIVALFIPDKTV